MACGLVLAAAPLLLASGAQFELPEPSSFVLLAAGVAGLGFAWRRSRTKK
ncbi:MAG: PEP-CTERM sorting domain-containing protein [Bryobacteraceae bacterium]|jgi:hypothetical protein